MKKGLINEVDRIPVRFKPKRRSWPPLKKQNWLIGQVSRKKYNPGEDKDIYIFRYSKAESASKVI